MKKLFEKFASWWKTERPQKREVNYLYFSFLLIFLSLLSLSHFLWIERPLFGIPLFFLLYALGQALLEISVFILIAWVLKRWAPRFVFWLFIAFSFILQLVHFTDFTLVRLMDVSVIYMFKFFFGGGMEHLTAASQALNFNRSMILMIFITVLSIPAVGLLFYWFTQKVAHQKPWKISLSQIVIVITSVGSALFLLDLIAHPFLNRLNYSKYQKTLPFGKTFLAPPLTCIELEKNLAAPRNEPTALPDYQAKSLPNIYFFVIETLRRDFITEEIAPHLTRFGKENIQFPLSSANANCTQLSWFALFHSDFPYHWAHQRDQWKQGSVPLRMLKKLGYKINVYSSADLRFFHMDKLLFGQNRELIDNLEEHNLNRDIEPCDRDALTFQSFAKDITNAKSANVFIFFLDSTHSEYSFPKDYPLKFEPIAKEIDYLTIQAHKKEVEWIKNRYRNSIHYVDHLIGNFLTLLKQNKLYDNSLISITGDHGEEFFEEGALFHGTHLNSYQLHVPIFLKFPNRKWKPLATEVTHMDLFPSILHYLTQQEDFSSYFDGQSIFSRNRWPFRIAVLQNGNETPTEFTLEQGEQRLRARIVNAKEIEVIEDSLERPVVEAMERMMEEEGERG